MKKWIFLLAVITIQACKSNNKEIITDSIIGEKTVNNELFNIRLKIKLLENDRLQLFFVDNIIENEYSVNKMVVVNVKGNKDFQVVEFELPTEGIPLRFRIDCGEYGIQTPIELESMTIKFKEKELIIRKEEFHRMMFPNVYLEQFGISSFLRKKINDRYDPYFESTSLLNKKIELYF